MCAQLREVQKCEIRRQFVGGDNEHCAILAGSCTLGWKLQRERDALSDFNHSNNPQRGNIMSRS